MKKELGKWFLDVSKYIFTGVLLSTVISDFEKDSILVFATIIGGLFFIFGLRAIRQAEIEDLKKQRNKGQKGGKK